MITFHQRVHLLKSGKKVLIIHEKEYILNKTWQRLLFLYQLLFCIFGVILILLVPDILPFPPLLSLGIMALCCILLWFLLPLLPAFLMPSDPKRYL